MQDDFSSPSTDIFKFFITVSFVGMPLPGKGLILKPRHNCCSFLALFFPRLETMYGEKNTGSVGSVGLGVIVVLLLGDGNASSTRLLLSINFSVTDSELSSAFSISVLS